MRTIVGLTVSYCRVESQYFTFGDNGDARPCRVWFAVGLIKALSIRLSANPFCGKHISASPLLGASFLVWLCVPTGETTGC